MLNTNQGGEVSNSTLREAQSEAAESREEWQSDSDATGSMSDWAVGGETDPGTTIVLLDEDEDDSWPAGGEDDEDDVDDLDDVDDDDDLDDDDDDWDDDDDEDWEDDVEEDDDDL
jgi:hypothetical protein